MRIFIPVLLLMLALLVFGQREQPAFDPHAALQQYLLEAEYGSAVSMHFASLPDSPLPSQETTSEVIAGLRSASAQQRWRAADELVMRKDTLAVEAIIAAMLDPAGTRRVCVMASALGRLKDPRALSVLSAAAFDRGNRDLRLCAIQSLGMIGDPEAVPQLIKALEARNMPVASANALARLGDERGVAPMIAVARADEELQLWMVAALGELGKSSALVYIEEVETAEPRRSLQQAAREARWKISLLSASAMADGLQRVLQTDTDPARRGWAAFKLGDTLADTAIASLIKALDDTDAGVRGRAAAALVRLGPNALQPLRNAMKVPQHAVYLPAIVGYTGTGEDMSYLQGLATESAQMSARMIERRLKHTGFTEL